MNENQPVVRARTINLDSSIYQKFRHKAFFYNIQWVRGYDYSKNPQTIYIISMHLKIFLQNRYNLHAFHLCRQSGYIQPAEDHKIQRSVHPLHTPCYGTSGIQREFVKVPESPRNTLIFGRQEWGVKWPWLYIDIRGLLCRVQIPV